MLEYGRILLYAGAAALFVSVGRQSRARGLFVIATALGCTVVGVAALGPWLLPADVPRRRRFRRFRLNWPTSYWNATGLIAALGVVLGMHLACSLRDHPVLRVLGAAAVPPLAATAHLQRVARRGRGRRDRHAVFLVVGPSRGMLTGLPVVAVAGAVAALALGISGLDATAAERRRAGNGRADGGAARPRRGAHRRCCVRRSLWADGRLVPGDAAACARGSPAVGWSSCS